MYYMEEGDSTTFLVLHGVLRYPKHLKKMRTIRINILADTTNSEAEKRLVFLFHFHVIHWLGLNILHLVLLGMGQRRDEAKVKAREPFI